MVTARIEQTRHGALWNIVETDVDSAGNEGRRDIVANSLDLWGVVHRYKSMYGVPYQAHDGVVRS
jgi:hypothetical protein